MHEIFMREKHAMKKKKYFSSKTTKFSLSYFNLFWRVYTNLKANMVAGSKDEGISRKRKLESGPNSKKSRSKSQFENFSLEVENRRGWKNWGGKGEEVWLFLAVLHVM